MLRCADLTEQSAIRRVLNPPQDVATDAAFSFTGRARVNVKSEFSIEVPVFLPQPQAALGNLPHPSPLGGAGLKHSFHEFLSLSIALRTHPPSISDLHFGLPILNLSHQHIDAS